MTKRMGRPKLPNGEAKRVQVGVRFNSDHDKSIEKAALDSGQTKADWVRNAAVSEARRPPPWIKCKWQMEELEGKKVKFRLSAPEFWVAGVGEFLVRRNPRGELAVEICVIKSATPFEIVETRYWLGQIAADKIESTCDPNVPFRLLG